MGFSRTCSTEFWILPRMEILESFLVHCPMSDFPYEMSVSLGLFLPYIDMSLVAVYEFCLLFNYSLLLSTWLQLVHTVGIWGSWGAIGPPLSTHFFGLNYPDSQPTISCLVFLLSISFLAFHKTYLSTVFHVYKSRILCVAYAELK